MPVVIPVAAIIVALLALLVLLSIPLMKKFISAIVPEFHVIGIGSLRGLVLGLVDDALNAVGNAMDAVLAPMAYFITIPFKVSTALHTAERAAISTVRGFAIGVVEVYIPKVTAGVKAYAAGIVAVVAGSVVAARTYLLDSIRANRAVAERYADGIVAVSTAAAKGLFHQAEKDIATATSTAAAATTKAIGTAEHYTDQAISKVNATIATLGAVSAAGVEGLITTALAPIESQLQSTLSEVQTIVTAGSSGVLSTLDGAIAGVSEAVWPDVEAAVGAASGVAAGDFGDILIGLKDIPIAQITDIAGVTALAAGTTIALTRYLEKCGLPNCRNLSGLGRDLQSLLSMVEDASFLGLIAGLISDPTGTAHTIESTLGGLAGDTLSAAESLFGVG